MSIIGDIFAALDRLKGGLRWWKERNNPVRTLPGRFLLLFAAHGVERTQIPRVLGPDAKLSISDLVSEEKLLESLGEPLLNQACELFGIGRQWLDGEGAAIYPYCGFYKDLNAFFDFASALKAKFSAVGYFVLKEPNHDLADKESHKDLVWIFRVPIAQLGEKTAYRYIPFTENYPWGHKPARLALKAMCQICWAMKIYPICRELPAKAIQQIISGIIFPHSVLEPLPSGMWHLDDYIFTNAESQVAKDEKEAVEVRQMLREQIPKDRQLLLL